MKREYNNYGVFVGKKILFNGVRVVTRIEKCNKENLRFCTEEGFCLSEGNILLVRDLTTGITTKFCYATNLFNIIWELEEYRRADREE